MSNESRCIVLNGTGGNRGTKQPKPSRKKGGGTKVLNQFDTSHQNLENYSKGVKNFFHAVSLIAHAHFRFHLKDIEFILHQVKERGTKLLLLPVGMTKRTANSSHIDPKSKALLWRINLAFVLDGGVSMTEICAFDSFVPTSSNVVVCQSQPVDQSLNPGGAKINFQAFSVHSALVGVCLNDVNENMSVQSIIENVLDNLPVR